jgi:hypothetical protein
MVYAQTNYPQTQGINGRYTIHDIGCFLTAFCNLLARFGRPIDPLSLNNIFRDRGIYIDVDDGIRDDLAWNSITQYLGDVVVTGTGGAGVPPTVNAIVKFIYQSKSKPWLDAAKTKPNIVTHFCLVDHIEGGTVYILDSWDGVVKNASNYGGVKAYATYQLNSPAPQPTGGTPMTQAEAEAIVDGLVYRGFLKRPGDAGGIKNYAAQLLKGNYEFIGSDVTASQEFKNIYVKTVEKVVPVEVIKEVPAATQPDPDGQKWRDAQNIFPGLFK